MNGQIIPFQTREHRTLAKAFVYFHLIKDDRFRSGDSVDRESIIPIAVYGATADERWGKNWRDDPGVKKAMDQEQVDSIRSLWTGRTNWEAQHWDQYSRRLEWLLARWLDGKLQRLRQRKPLRPPRRRIPSDAPLAQIVPFPMPVAPPPRYGDPVTAAYVKLIGEATRLELAGINPPNWKDHVDAVLDKAYSELD